MKQTIRFALIGVVLFVLASTNYQLGGYAAVGGALFFVSGMVGGMLLGRSVLRKLPEDLILRHHRLNKLVWLFVLLIIPAVLLNFLCPVSDICFGVNLFVMLPLVELGSEHHKLTERLKTRQIQSQPAATI